MNINIKPMEISDIQEVVDGWNKTLIYDQVNEERFKNVIIDDANYEKESTFVAIYDNKIVGFIGAVAREGILGADNRGKPEQANFGYIKGFYVLDDFRKNGIGSMLLDKAIDYIKHKNKSFIKILEYTGNYFFPGIDMRYESAINFFENKGFHREYVINDVDIDLTDFKIGDYQKNAIERAKSIDISVVDYDPSMLDEMRKFAEKLNMISWFPEGWENWFKSKGNKVVALKGKEIVGWASFGVSGEIGWFGPTGVLVEMRHNGIGSWILLESVLQMKSAGAKRVIASWANTPFYIANGWKICRQYGVYEKQIKKNDDK
jgi:GNAT superfamily N-acetyltransferase